MLFAQMNERPFFLSWLEQIKEITIIVYAVMLKFGDFCILIEIYYSFFTDLLNDFSLLSPVRRILKMDTIE